MVGRGRKIELRVSKPERSISLHIHLDRQCVDCWRESLLDAKAYPRSFREGIHIFAQRFPLGRKPALGYKGVGSRRATGRCG